MPSTETIRPVELLDVSIDLTSKGLSLVNLDQYWGLWAVHRSSFEATIATLQRVDMTAHVQANKGRQSEDNHYALQAGGVALIEINGTMTKRGSSMSESGSTLRARRAVRQARRSGEVNAIVLHIESPGGSVAGVKELADEVAAAAGEKRTVAVIEDIGASAAYWVASQASEVYANEMAVIGSIGVYMAVADYSQMAAKEGIKVHVLSTGNYKGAGVVGSEIKDEHLAEWQRLINQTNEYFLAAVGGGRGLPPAAVAQLADGRVHMAGDAVELKLVDAVRTLDQVLTDLSAGTSQGGRRMSDTTTKTDSPAAATLEQLEAAFPKGTADWLMSQLKAKATLEQARANWQTKLEADLEAATAKAEAAEQAKTEAEKNAAAAAGAGRAPGNDPVGTKNVGAGAADMTRADYVAEWRNKVDTRAKELSDRRPGMRPSEVRREAMRFVRQRNPDLAAALDEGTLAAQR